MKSDIKGSKNVPDSEELVLVPYNRISPQLIVCDMCGHQNLKDNELCEKCSNYLKG